ncbi:hypothetical protein PFISCL1PPCAC_21820, partial [Pristionchus fissidentatus]
SKDTSSAQLPVLDRVSESYKVLCETRLMGELSARVSPPHPLEMNDADFTPIPATPSAFDHANRLFLSALLHFGARAFPEFAELSKDEKWTVVTHFYCRFRLFETGYRANKRFNDYPDRSFSSHTMYVDDDVARTFYPDDDANRCMARSLKRNIPPARARFRRLRLHQEEFLAVATIMFWDVDCMDVSPAVVCKGERYRERVMSELHTFYRNNLCLDNYATRVGELLTLPDIYQCVADDMKKVYELLRLLDVFSDETFVYRVCDRK